MRKASKILGIVGGVLAVISALLAITGGIVFKTTIPVMAEYIDQENAEHNDAEYETDYDGVHFGSRLAGFFFIGLGIVLLLAGAAGIVGGALVTEHNMTGGIMMIISSIVCLFTGWGILSFFLLMLGGIFAFIKDYKELDQKA